jgi:hypothetical protein
MPKFKEKVKVQVGWAPNIRRERVGIMLITLMQQGHINLSPEQLVQLLHETSFPTIAHALDEQVIAGRVAQVGSIGPNNPEAIRQIARDIINERK